MFSILHISDLHRSRDEPSDNDSLVAALLADCDRYLGETPVVPFPNAIVVSGDIIQGAPIGVDNWQEVMKDQYRVAEDFLDHLTRRFLNGDRSRLIIVPGNHDVCWNTSFASMERIESEYPTNVRKALTGPDSNYRWSWKELALYRIQDKNAYKNRLSAYWNFVEGFYADVQLLKPIDRNRGFQLFELHDRKIIVVAFDSISNNDCFSYSGKIPQGAIARSANKLRDIPHSYDLRLAVWHHSIHGPPMQDDYMEIGQIHEMVGLGFHLGMHGHQHVAEATTQYIHLNESQAMAVVSAGSLCAGSNELPRGVNRQYNLIVIEDDMRRARVHVREMAEGGQFS
jgi:Calcineurin-like phosphoesterase